MGHTLFGSFFLYPAFAMSLQFKALIQKVGQEVKMPDRGDR
jgi:hypothetical protein